MRPVNFHTEDLVRLLRQRKIATMDELKTVLGTRADSTVFRKLAELAYRTSYTHRGRFYTLDETCRFDEHGLWSFRQVWFSAHGTLLATVQALVGASQAGYTAAELTQVLHVQVKAALVSLVRQQRITRTQTGRRWLYTAADAPTRGAQLAARQVLQAQPGTLATPVPVPMLPEELKAAIVLFYSLLDEQQRRLYAGLEAAKLGHGGDTQIAELLGVDVGTVARGRRELLAGEVAPGRIRRPGGGRPPKAPQPWSSPSPRS